MSSVIQDCIGFVALLAIHENLANMQAKLWIIISVLEKNKSNHLPGLLLQTLTCAKKMQYTHTQDFHGLPFLEIVMNGDSKVCPFISIELKIVKLKFNELLYLPRWLS